MGGFIILAAIIYIIVQVVKESSMRQIPDGTDLRASIMDASLNHLSQRQVRKNLMSGKYVKK